MRKTEGASLGLQKDNTLFVFDNARIHTTVVTRGAVAMDGWRCMTLAPYSPEQNLAELFIKEHKLVIMTELRKNK